MIKETFHNISGYKRLRGRIHGVSAEKAPLGVSFISPPPPPSPTKSFGETKRCFPFKIMITLCAGNSVLKERNDQTVRYS